MKTVLIVPAVTDQAGQCRIVASEGNYRDALRSYRANPEKWSEVGLMNSQGRVVCLSEELQKFGLLTEMRDCEPLMASTQFLVLTPMEICVAAIPRIPHHELHDDDQHVPGVYNLVLPGHVPREQCAAAALDTFHSTCPVRILDDFDFVAFFPQDQLVLDDPNYQVVPQHRGTKILKVSDKPPRVFEFGHDHLQGKQIVASSRGEAWRIAQALPESADAEPARPRP